VEDPAQRDAVRRGWLNVRLPAIAHHPIRAVLKTAHDQMMIVLEVNLPMPAPIADNHHRIWARVRVGLRDAEIRRLPAFLEAVERQIRHLTAVPCDARVRTVPGGRLRVIVAAPSDEAPPQGASAAHSRLVLAGGIDVAACATGAQLPGPEVPDWRVLALCTDLRVDVETVILRWMGRCWPGMRLAGLSYAVLHGTVVMLMLVHQPDGSTEMNDLDRLARHYADSHVRVLYDEWQSPKQLGLVPDQSLLGGKGLGPGRVRGDRTAHPAAGHPCGGPPPGGQPHRRPARRSGRHDDQREPRPLGGQSGGANGSGPEECGPGVSGPRYAPAMDLFVLTMVNGPEYDRSRSRREQRGWDEHAAFMDGLLEEGFVVLGGPIGDGEKVMLVVEAADEEAVRGRLGPDPWAAMGVLVIGSVQPWTIWLDSRPWAPAAPGAPATPGSAAAQVAAGTSRD
jgi:uncharacterized protein YciI